MRRLVVVILALGLGSPALAGTSWGGHKTVKPGGTRGGATRPGGTRGGTRGGSARPGGTRGGAARPGGTRGGASPAAGPKGEDPEEEPKPAVVVEKSKDVVILSDGTKIVGTIIAVGQKRLIIIEEDAKTDRAIDRSEVESFRRGPSKRQTTSYDVKKDTDKGVLVLSEQGVADPTTTPAVKPGPKLGPGPKPGPNPKPKPAPVKAKLGKLWGLLDGNPTPAQLADAFAKNPDWNGQVNKLIKDGKVPPEGLKAFKKFRTRVKSDAAFRNGLADLVRKGKLPRSVLEILRAK